jgi:hypothetical protein
MSQNGEDNRSSGDSCRGSSRVTGGCEAEARWFWCSRGPIASVERRDNGHKKASHGAELLDAWGIAEMGWRECAGWCEMDSETATWVQVAGKLAMMQRAAASARDTALFCLLYTGKVQRVDATRKAGSDVGRKVRWRKGAEGGCLAPCSHEARAGGSGSWLASRWAAHRRCGADGFAACLGSVFRARDERRGVVWFGVVRGIWSGRRRRG